MFRPNVQQLATQIRIQHRMETYVNGASEVFYQDADSALDFCNWKSRGGTESTASGTLTVEDTAEVTMWYRPDLTQQDRLLLHDNPELAYEVIGPPEDIEQRHMWLILKVKRVVNT